MTTMTSIPEIANLLLRRSKNVIVLAGAGMSAELGTPVYYEGPNASYGTQKSEYGYTALEHAFAPLWEDDPKNQKAYSRKRWEYMLSIDVKQENSPYAALLNYLEENNKDYFVSTTNVDSAFLRAGYSEQRLHEVHGSSRVSQCLIEPGHGIFPTQDPTLGYTSCPECGGDTRPNTMYFLDFYFNSELLQEQQWRYINFIENIAPEETVVLEIGAGETVATLRQASRKLNSIYGFDLIRINPQEDNAPNLPIGLPSLPNSPTAVGSFVHLRSGVNNAFTTLLDTEI